MSNHHYQQLQNTSWQNEKLLGVKLPKLVNAALEVSSCHGSAQTISEQIQALKPTQGWIMYRDKLEISALPPTRSDFIEGEWCNSEQTLKVKHLHDETYLLTSMVLASCGDEKQAYTEQIVYLRNNLKKANEYNATVYRQWYQQAQSGDYQGRWQPYMQQFTGFKYCPSHPNSDIKE